MLGNLNGFVVACLLFSKSTFNKQIQRIYVPRHLLFVFEYMSYHETT